MSLTIKEPHTPFYKEPYVLLLVIFPFAAVIWGVVILTLAFDSKDSLVSDSYYKEGVTYTENHDLELTAQALKISADIQFGTDSVELQLQSQHQQEPHALQLQLIHPTLQERDVVVFMQRIGPNQYAGVLEETLKDKRHIWLSSPEQHWRIKTTDDVFAGKLLRF